MKTAHALVSLASLVVSAAFPAHGSAQAAHSHPSTVTAAKATSPEALAWFNQLKKLAGTWKGTGTTDPVVPQMVPSDSMTVTMRVTSLGNSIMHNMTSPARPDDPITMLYMENDRLLLTHYCDSGNRPRMEATMSPDGKTVTFQFLDLVGPTTYGHMNRAQFTFIDDNHHIEEWTYVAPSGKAIRARFDLYRRSAKS
jgi:hypothetical protein